MSSTSKNKFILRNALLLKMFVVLPALPFLVCYTLWGLDYWWAVVLCGVLLYYPVHQLGQALGYHKLFSHRSFKARRFYPYLSAFFGSIAFYGDPLSAAIVHRMHHKHADTDKDPHTPIRGRFHAYIGWVATYKPTARDILCVQDLMRDYPWMLTFRKYEWLLPWVFHGILYALSPIVSCAFLIACQLSIHNAFFVNAFSHNPKVSGSDKSVDSLFLARFVNPIFLHRHHHKHGQLLDYSSSGVTDYWARFAGLLLQSPN